MIAFVGTAGSAHFEYRQFGRGQRQEMDAWVSATSARIRHTHPHDVPDAGTLSDRKAKQARWADGSPVFRF